MLYVLRIHSMGARYAVGAGCVYFLGFVFGGWWYAKWWRQSQASGPLPKHAKPEDQLAYESKQKELDEKFSWISHFSGIGGGGDDPLSAILTLIGMIVLAIFLVVLLFYLPMLATESLAGFLAEIVLEFVIGAIMYRRILKPRGLDDYWAITLKKTWVAGMFLIALCGVTGYALQSSNPDAKTLFEVLNKP